MRSARAGVNPILGLELPHPVSDPLLEAESKPLLDIERQSDDVPFQELLTGRPGLRPPKPCFRSSLRRLYSLEVANAAQQAKMLMAIKLQVAPTRDPGDVFPAPSRHRKTYTYLGFSARGLKSGREHSVRRS